MAPSCVIAALRPELLRSLKRTLEPELEVVAMVDNPMSLQDSMKALVPDFAVVDLEVLEPSPWKQLSLLLRRSPGATLIVLGELADEAEQEEARAAGADRVLPRSRAGYELAAAVREVLAR